MLVARTAYEVKQSVAAASLHKWQGLATDRLYHAALGL